MEVMGMNNRVRMAGVVLLGLSAVAPVLAQGDTYKAKCQSCHGATGMADTGGGKAMKVKPATDPEVKAMTEDQMIAVVTDGKGKMPAYKGKLTDAQIKDSVAYYRTFVK
jgi:mono/diheme cytochrome c family protein